jgi:hypothetical protein
LAFRQGQVVPGTSRMPISGPIVGGALPLVQNGAPWTQSATLATLQRGDTIAVTYRANGSPINVYYGDQVTLSFVIIHGAGGWAVNLQQASNSTVDHVRIEPRPGALIGSSADGIHFADGLRNNHITNCFVTRTVDDALIFDSLNVATLAKQSGPRQITVTRTVYARFPNGTAVDFVDPATAAEIPGGTIVSQDPPDGRTPALNGQVSLTFDRDLPTLPTGAGMAFSDREMRGGDSTMEDNIVEDIPFGRGIWIGGSQGILITRNVIRQTSSGGVVISQNTAAAGSPGPPASGVTVRSNALEGNLGPMASGTGTQTSLAAVILESTATTFRFSSSSVNSAVLVQNNYIDDSGRGGVWFGEANGGTITGNLVTRWYQHPELPIWGIAPDLLPQVQQDITQAIVVRYSTGVTTDGNDTSPRSRFVAPVTFGSQTLNAGAAGGSYRVDVATAIPAFEWRATVSDSWITLSGSNGGAGGGTLAVVVLPNTTGAARQGTITVAGETVTVMQSAS